MPGLRPDIDPDGLLEYSVVFTDRALNHMSRRFQQVMRDIAEVLREAYRGATAIVVPGSGSFGMEAIARQFAGGRKVLVLRTGWFSFRWTQILEAGRIPSAEIVLKARPLGTAARSPFEPPPLAEVLATIRGERPALVFAAHVETAAGIVLPDAYLRAVSQAVHEVGGMLVLDCVASGALWVDMQDLGVDVLLSAPQKGWSGSPCCAFVLLGERARQQIEDTTSSSFAADLKKWMQIMAAYEGGGHAYHATMPTDALARTRDAMLETRARGFATLRTAQEELGRRVRAALVRRGLPSVAAEGFQAASVVVSFCESDAVQNGRAFLDQGLQVAAGVPLRCDEGADFKTFRVGLFGLDKLGDVAGAVGRLEQALDRIFPT